TEAVIETQHGHICAALAGRDEMKISSSSGKIGQWNKLQDRSCNGIDRRNLIIRKRTVRARIAKRYRQGREIAGALGLSWDGAEHVKRIVAEEADAPARKERVLSRFRSVGYIYGRTRYNVKLFLIIACLVFR